MTRNKNNLLCYVKNKNNLLCYFLYLNNTLKKHLKILMRIQWFFFDFHTILVKLET